MRSALQRRLGVGAAIAMIVAEVMGVGVFLTPAGMARTVGSTEWVFAVWAVMGLLSLAGALCYAELGSRFPEAGGGYVFLREAYGERCAFVYGWMALLVMDPGLTAALGVGLARYLLAVVGGAEALVPAVAIAAILALAGGSILGLKSSARLLRWTAAVKLAAIAVLVVAALAWGDRGGGVVTGGVMRGGALPPFTVLAGALMGAFFALGGWWGIRDLWGPDVAPAPPLAPAA
jgi:APA family basic amino acid/polyamine antiporter